MQKQDDRKEGHWVGRELQQITWWDMRGPGAVGATVCVCVCVCALALLGTSRTLLMPCKLLLHLLIRTETLALQHH